MQNYTHYHQQFLPLKRQYLLIGVITNIFSNTTPPSAGAAIELFGILNLTANDIVDVRVSSTSGSFTLTIDDANLSIFSVGSSSTITSAEVGFANGYDVIARRDAGGYTVAAASSGNSTFGRAFFYDMQAVAQAKRITGIKFYWSGGASITITCKLWKDDGDTLITSGTVAVSAAANYSVTFASPYTCIAGEVFNSMVATCSGSYYSYVTGFPTQFAVEPTTIPYVAGPGVWWNGNRYVASTSADPTTVDPGSVYLVQPIFG